VAAPIVTRAPTRIDFGGGWTDVPPYSDELGGFVCNLAIARYATVTLTRGAGATAIADERASDRAIGQAAARRFHMNDANLSVRSDFPIGAGLGGSSAAGVASVAALAAARGESMQPRALAELSRQIEVVDLGINGGRQDHYAAAFGGALGLRFSAKGVEVRNIPMAVRTRAELERRCIIVYTGESRLSGSTIGAVMDAYRRNDTVVRTSLQRMRALAESMAESLATGDLDTLGRLVGEHWTHQRALNPAIPTPAIDEIIAKGAEAGAIGGKALGASGGGCVLIVARGDRVQEVRTAVESLGEIIQFTIAAHGVERWP